MIVPRVTVKVIYSNSDSQMKDNLHLGDNEYSGSDDNKPEKKGKD